MGEQLEQPRRSRSTDDERRPRIALKDREIVYDALNIVGAPLPQQPKASGNTDLPGLRKDSRI